MSCQHFDVLLSCPLSWLSWSKILIHNTSELKASMIRVKGLEVTQMWVVHARVSLYYCSSQSFLMSHFHDVILMKLSHSKDFQIIASSLKYNEWLRWAYSRSVVEGKQELRLPGSLVRTAGKLGSTFLLNISDELYVTSWPLQQVGAPFPFPTAPQSDEALPSIVFLIRLCQMSSQFKSPLTSCLILNHFSSFKFPLL